VESLSRADAVVVTHAEGASNEEVERIIAAAKRVNPGVVVAVCRHRWGGLRRGSNDAVVPVGVLAGTGVLVVSAIGNPRAFGRAVRACGARVEREIVLGDHDPYETATVESIARAAEGVEAMVTTEKDWTKLGRARVDWACPVYRPMLDLDFDRGWDELWALVGRGVGMEATSPTLHVSEAVGTGGVTRPA
jgi:tetraacyldisaccharide-1-P 4'-kinase